MFKQLIFSLVIITTLISCSKKRKIDGHWLRVDDIKTKVEVTFKNDSFYVYQNDKFFAKNNITGFESNKLGDFYYRIDENSELEFTMYYRLKNDSLFFCDRSFDSIRDEREVLKFIRLN